MNNTHDENGQPYLLTFDEAVKQLQPAFDRARDEIINLFNESGLFVEDMIDYLKSKEESK